MTASTRPLWHTESRPFETLRDGLNVDVAVIGAGITGLTAAVLLHERGKSVAVLDMSGVAGGETGASTSHLTEAIDDRYHSIRRSFGLDNARLAGAALRSGIECVANLSAKYSIDCGFRRLPGYLYTEKRGRVGALKSEAASARDAGINASWTDAVPLPFPTRGAVRFEDQAQFNPRAYVLGLAAQLAGRVYENARVTSVTDGAPCVIETSAGRLTANGVLIATNIPLNDMTTQPKLAQYRTYVIAAPAEGDVPDGMFWDTAEPYHYTRWQDGSIIVGGEDHKVGHEGDDPEAYARLEEFARERFKFGEVTHRWSGQIVEPTDGLPFIGKQPGANNVYIATGYAGQGTGFGSAAGILIADLLTTGESQWAALFDPSRTTPTASLITENVDFPLHLLRDRLASRDVSPGGDNEVRSGEGKIVMRDGRKVAAARDDAGVLHTLSPVCRHLGCDVAWNDAEKTWDCPCHGSRYAVDGRVINGPASEGLEKV